jgi:hypothetical protein
VEMKTTFKLIQKRRRCDILVENKYTRQQEAQPEYRFGDIRLFAPQKKIKGGIVRV